MAHAQFAELDVAGQVCFLLNQNGVIYFYLFRKVCPLFYILLPPEVPCHAVQAPCSEFVLMASASLQLCWKNLADRNPLLFSTERSVSECKHNRLMHLYNWMINAWIL